MEDLIDPDSTKIVPKLSTQILIPSLKFWSVLHAALNFQPENGYPTPRNPPPPLS